MQNRVRLDINTAKLIYNNKLEKIMSLVQFTADGSDLQELIGRDDITGMKFLQGLIRRGTGTQQGNDNVFLDMLTVVDTSGKVLYRAANPAISKDNLLKDPVVRNCIRKKISLSSTELMSIKDILRENPTLSQRAKTDIVKTPLSADIKEDKLSEGMVMKVAYPIMDRNTNVLLGVLVGGVLINKDNEIVDKIKETMYHGEKYKGQEMGVATIFQGGVRISTNVMTKDNKRAIGTILSKEVYDRVIKEGKDWVGRAFVVKDWYITTYTPIYNIDKKLIGVLYTGILEAKYKDIQRGMIWINLGITTLGMIIAFLISLLGNTIIKRIRILKKATEAIASGNLDYKLSPDTISGFDMLDEAFNDMARSLKDHNDQLQKMHQQLAKAEKLTALGELAAGVAHEINNPLGGILLYSSIVLEDIEENSPLRENIQKVIYQTNRCKEIVQSLLDFARTPTSEMLPLQINQVISTSLKLVRDQSMFHGIEIETKFVENLPETIGDRSRLEEVFLNLFINAADAMKGGGKLTITTGLSKKNNSIRILISDTGKGIDKEHLSHIFEPFYTTKEPGQGTGLGLSIVYGIIRKHKGTIDAECKPGKGTSFIICLPAYTGENNSLNNNAVCD